MHRTCVSQISISAGVHNSLSVDQRTLTGTLASLFKNTHSSVSDGATVPKHCNIFSESCDKMVFQCLPDSRVFSVPISNVSDTERGSQ